MNAAARMADLRNALMPWLYYNAHRGHHPEKDVESFMPAEWRRPRKRQTGADVIARFRALKGQ
jgi:hypothetical protein